MLTLNSSMIYFNIVLTVYVHRCNDIKENQLLHRWLAVEWLQARDSCPCSHTRFATIMQISPKLDKGCIRLYSEPDACILQCSISTTCYLSTNNNSSVNQDTVSTCGSNHTNALMNNLETVLVCVFFLCF